MGSTREHELGFLIWSAAGFLLAFGAVTSIGLPFLGLGLLLFVILVFKGPVWPADLGLLAGIGTACLVIATINVIGGDLSPTVWLALGIALVGSSAGVFWWLQCRPDPASSSVDSG